MFWGQSQRGQTDSSDMFRGETMIMSVEGSYGCGEGGHEVNRCEGGECRGQDLMQTDGGRPLEGKTETREVHIWTNNTFL